LPLRTFQRTLCNGTNWKFSMLTQSSTDTQSTAEHHRHAVRNHGVVGLVETLSTGARGIRATSTLLLRCARAPGGFIWDNAMK
jgi:hypothetical protein